MYSQLALLRQCLLGRFLIVNRTCFCLFRNRTKQEVFEKQESLSTTHVEPPALQGRRILDDDPNFRPLAIQSPATYENVLTVPLCGCPPMQISTDFNSSSQPKDPSPQRSTAELSTNARFGAARKKQVVKELRKKITKRSFKTLKTAFLKPFCGSTTVDRIARTESYCASGNGRNVDPQRLGFWWCKRLYHSVSKTTAFLENRPSNASSSFFCESTDVLRPSLRHAPWSLARRAHQSV